MCERFTRSCFGFPARYASAKLAYEASKRDGRVHVDYNAPAGVPVFWDILTGPNAPYDHVAVSVGGGWCVSTSAGPGKTVAKVRIDELTRRWGMRYLGWAEVYHGQGVYTPPQKAAAPKPDDDWLDMNEDRLRQIIREELDARVWGAKVNRGSKRLMMSEVIAGIEADLAALLKLTKGGK